MRVIYTLLLYTQVIRSLKRALQPAVTDVSVEFKVPGDFVVQQSPQNLPPVYNGEKMVVYGVLSPKGTPQDKELSGKAILKGQIFGKKMEHSVPFSFNPVATRSPSLPAIHHLAAKALIKDWEDQGKNKEEIAKLSVDSSVISSHTAFIAVDEESSEPITGAMKTWDVHARYHAMSAFRGFRGGGAAMAARCRSAPMKKKGVVKKASKNKSAVPLSRSRKCEVAKEFDLEVSRSRRRSRSRSRSPVDISRLSVSSGNNLNTIIAAQQANGSWTLDTVTACMQGKSETEIKDACPVEIKGTVAVIWATVLILTLLKKKYSSQQDEWELIAMKAESWVKKQAQSSGIAVKDFYTAAEQLSIL